MNTNKDEVFYRNIEKNDSYFSVANPFTDLTFNQTDNTLKCRGNINFTLDLNKMDMDYRINVTVGRPFGGETYLTFPTAIEIGTKHGDTLSYNQFEKVFGVQPDFIDQS